MLRRELVGQQNTHTDRELSIATGSEIVGTQQAAHISAAGYQYRGSQPSQVEQSFQATHIEYKHRASL